MRKNNYICLNNKTHKRNNQYPKYMKRFILAVFASLMMMPLGAAEVWPDGTPIDKWFTSKPEKLPAKQLRRFMVTDYGVVNDSTILQTEAIQKVIDLAAVDGGTVVIPKGVYLTSSLFFTSGTHLYLEKGAVLKGSDDISDYPVRPVHIEGVIQPYIAAVINAYDVDGFSIKGDGVIDGNGLRYWRDFWTRRRVNPMCTNLEALRPRMVYVANGKNIHIEGVTLRNSGFWTTHLYKCDHVRMQDVTIYAPNEPIPAPSSDAIDLDGCNNVHITGCRISVNDDIVCLKGGKGPWADTDPANATNSNILVEKCWFGRGPGVLTFGSECVGGRNVILRDSEVHGATRVLQFKMRPDTPQNYEYVLVENLTGESRYFFYVAPWTQFFDLKGREDIPMSYGSHVVMRNCTMTCEEAVHVVEKDDQYILTDIVIENNNITETGPRRPVQRAPRKEDWQMPKGTPDPRGEN